MVVTTQSNGNGRWAFRALGGLGVALLIAAACAGTDTPARTRSLEAEIIEEYEPSYAMGNAGGSSMAGAGGGGQGGSGSSNAGAGGSGTAAAGSGSGAAGSGAAGSGSGNYCDAPATVLRPACGFGSGCHGADSRFGDFGDSEAAARALVDIETANGCGSYIDSANPEQSQILVKLGDDIPGGCGVQMPFNLDPLPQSEIDCVSDWLSQF